MSALFGHGECFLPSDVFLDAEGVGSPVDLLAVELRQDVDNALGSEHRIDVAQYLVVGGEEFGAHG